MAPRRGFIVVNRLRRGFELLGARRLVGFLRRQAERLGAAVERFGPDEVPAVVLSGEDELLSIMRPVLAGPARRVAEFRLESLGADARLLSLDVELFAAERAGEAVVGISEQTRRAVRREIVAGIADGLSVEELGLRVRRAMAGTSSSRARLIARTEVGVASSVADFRAASDSGVARVKRWLTARDGGVRHPSALGLEGQTREIADFFSVRGSPMGHPLDPAGPARERIACRCALDYSTR